MIDKKYDEIHDLIGRGSFRPVLGTILPDGSSIVTVIYDIVIKSHEDKER